MGLVQESDVAGILQDPVLMDEVVQVWWWAKLPWETLADEIAGELQGALEGDSDMRKRLVDAAMGSDHFKKKLVTKLVDDLS